MDNLFLATKSLSEMNSYKVCVGVVAVNIFQAYDQKLTWTDLLNTTQTKSMKSRNQLSRIGVSTRAGKQRFGRAEDSKWSLHRKKEMIMLSVNQSALETTSTKTSVSVRVNQRAPTFVGITTWILRASAEKCQSTRKLEQRSPEGHVNTQHWWLFLQYSRRQATIPGVLFTAWHHNSPAVGHDSFQEWICLHKSLLVSQCHPDPNEHKRQPVLMHVGEVSNHEE